MSLRHKPESEVVLRDGLHTVDIRLAEEGGARPVAVSVEGPTHFSRNNLQPMGLRGKVERAAVEAEGWRLVQVPFFNWAKLRSAEDKQKYMQKRLTQNGQ